MSSNRWVIAAAGTLAMMCLGTVYSWSVFTQPLIAAFHWSNTQTTAAFALAILFLGLGAVVGGRWQDRRGPRPVAITGVVLWGISNVLAGLGVRDFGAPWMYLTYGVVGGLGLGLGYVTPVAAVAKWFPRRRGFGTGMVVMGFGLGAFIYNNVLKAIPAFAAVAAEGGRVLAARASGDGTAVLGAGSVVALTRTFVWSGIVFGALGGLCASFLGNPGGAPAAPEPAPDATGGTPPLPPGQAEDWPPSRAMRTPQFWALWAMLFLNVTAGILFISNAVPIMRELTGASPAIALAIYAGTGRTCSSMARRSRSSSSWGASTPSAW
jgi:OFA family oxalate/formate antiporter-like MFS transporter